MDAGLFGGTFNPLHNGHLDIAQYVKDHCGLDRIFLYPSSVPPHKSQAGLAPARDRMKMVTEAAAPRQGFFASDIELHRRGPSFTIDTIHEFQKAWGKEIRFHLLMGSDAFFDITTWKQNDKIFKTVPIIVMIRGEKRDVAPFASYIDERISKGYKLEEDNIFIHDFLKPIRICNVPRIDISSTQIRNRVKRGESITGLVPEHVETLIRTKDLYR
ncbi:MAG: nicotinate (nicotinamide) nucleotide adenylyltransferase [Desulfobacter sp.]|nr:MAG: nicotinate (nicotinamide) nucleotide adenylyltransferase [Desulfobacter sp.]